MEAEESSEAASVREVGSVWLVGHVARKTAIPTDNRFQILSSEEESDFPTLHETTCLQKESHPKASDDNAWIVKESQSPKKRKWVPMKEKLVAPVTKIREGDNQEPPVHERLIAPVTKTPMNVGQMTFHVTDAKKFLASVNRITQVGNKVLFEKNQSYIQSPSGKKAMLVRRNGVYILDVIFLSGDKRIRGEVVVDSGAADNVMPRGSLEEVELKEKEAGVKFVGADGGEIGNYGRKEVRFVPTEFWEEQFGTPFRGRT